MLQILGIVAVVATVIAIVIAVRKQARVTQSISVDEQVQNARVFEQSAKVMEANVAEALAEKARDPRLATMTQEDLATMAGTTRPTANRVLHAGVEAGYLRLGRGRIEVLDAAALTHAAR